VNVGELVSVKGTTGDQSRSRREATSESQPIVTDEVASDIRRGLKSHDVAESPIDPQLSREDDEAVNIDTIESWDTRTAYALRSLSAKAVCKALIEFFSIFGVPTYCHSDCGANFTSKLTCLMLQRMGCSPRFNTRTAEMGQFILFEFPVAV